MGNTGTGYSAGKGKYMGDTDEEGPDPFALREVSFISGDVAGLRQHNAQRWTGLHQDTPTAVSFTSQLRIVPSTVIESVYAHRT